MTQLPLISKPLCQFTADEYYAFISDMYALPRAKAGKPASAAPGLSVTRTKAGALSVRRNKQRRAFDWVTVREVQQLAAAAKCSQADLWNAFKRRNFIIALNRLEAEQLYAKLKEIPWR